MFAQNETILKFVSDKENSRIGFDIRIRQIKICSPEAKGNLIENWNFFLILDINLIIYKQLQKTKKCF